MHIIHSFVAVIFSNLSPANWQGALTHSGTGAAETIDRTLPLSVLSMVNPRVATARGATLFERRNVVRVAMAVINMVVVFLVFLVLSSRLACLSVFL